MHCKNVRTIVIAGYTILFQLKSEFFRASEEPIKEAFHLVIIKGVQLEIEECAKYYSSLKHLAAMAAESV